MNDYQSKIEMLEAKGYEVKLYHYRLPHPEKWTKKPPTKSQDIREFVMYSCERYYRRDSNDFEPYEYGGVTVCELFKDGYFVLDAMAVCSLSDHYNYKRGNQIAVGRAFKRWLLETSTERQKG